MAAGTAALIGTGISAFQTLSSLGKKNSIEDEFNNYKRNELKNPYENMKLSTYGTDVMREESARNVASLTDSAISAGVRGVMGAIPKIQASANQVAQQIGTNLEEQDQRRQYAIAQGDERIMAMKENRDNQNLAALSSQYNAANQDFNQGLWGIASGISSFANAGGFNSSNPQAQSVNSGISPQGFSAFTSQPKATLPNQLPSSFYNRQ